MKACLLFTLLMIFLLRSLAHGQSIPGGMLLNKSYVNLKGREGVTILVNETADTLRLSYMFFNWLPYVETRDALTIAPRKKDTLKLSFNFPDFIRLNSGVALFNGPGDTLVCHILSYSSGSINLNFTGRYAQENAYYLSYHKQFGSIDQEGAPYYTLSETLKDWNQFPAKGDSITSIRLKFLEQYKEPLPNWFRAHEHRRLLYNNYFRLENALLSKEGHSGRKISVSPAYYSFEKLLGKEDDMVLNETYLYCMSDYFGRQAKLRGLSGTTASLYATDRLHHRTDIGDVSLMRRLGLLYRSDKPAYDSVIQVLKFKEPQRKIWLDSLVQTKLGTPYIGKKAPAMTLTDTSGKAVSLADYVGRMVIVNFWAVWCAPCIAEFPEENKLYQQYRDKGLTIINVCFDSDPEQWKQVSKRNNLQMVNLYTAKADYNKLLKSYNLSAPPRSILINRQGKVADNYLKRASMLSGNEIAKILNQK